LAAISFDDQLMPEAEEIGDIRSDRRLASELGLREC